MPRLRTHPIVDRRGVHLSPPRRPADRPADVCRDGCPGSASARRLLRGVRQDHRRQVPAVSAATRVIAACAGLTLSILLLMLSAFGQTRVLQAAAAGMV